jgi:hypothetical protein
VKVMVEINAHLRLLSHSVPQPHAHPAAVLRSELDEDHASGFEGEADWVEVERWPELAGFNNRTVFSTHTDMVGKRLCENPLKSRALERLRIALPGVVGFLEILD